MRRLFMTLKVTVVFVRKISLSNSIVRLCLILSYVLMRLICLPIVYYRLFEKVMHFKMKTFKFSEIFYFVRNDMFRMNGRFRSHITFAHDFDWWSSCTSLDCTTDENRQWLKEESAFWRYRRSQEEKDRPLRVKVDQWLQLLKCNTLKSDIWIIKN